MPVAWAWLWLKAQPEPEWGFGLRARRGHAPSIGQDPIWVHAASVGEVNSALSLIRALRKRWPEVPLLLTAFTATGCQRWRSVFEEDQFITVSALPLDHPVWVRRWLETVQPCIFLSVETEIWPNLFLALHARHIPVVVSSARISESSQRGWQRWLGRALLGEVLAPVAHIGAQTVVDAERFRSLGAKSVRVDGSLKWDASGADLRPVLLQGLRDSVGERRCWLAASTHQGEDEVVLAVHAELLKMDPGLCLLLAPRHPRRAGSIVELCEQAGLRVAQRSRGDSPERANVWLIDTLGELQEFMAIAEWVFMGGSLVPVGGHNLLEPAMLARPIVTGPHTENAAEIANELERGGALLRAGCTDELLAVAQRWLRNPEQAEKVASQARVISEKGRGALQKTLLAVEAALQENEGADHAAPS